LAGKGPEEVDARPPQSLTRWQLLLRRRRFLIGPSLQLPLLLATFGHLLIVSLAIAAGLFGPSILSLLTSSQTSDRALSAASQILFLHSRFWPVLALALLLVTLDSIRITHKVAGPLFRLDRVLARIRQGRIPETVRLRKGDLLQDNFQRINATLELLRGHHREVRESRLALVESLRAVREAQAAGMNAELEHRLNDLAGKAERLAELSQRFDLDGSDQAS
jgi:hypothetical protein